MASNHCRRGNDRSLSLCARHYGTDQSEAGVYSPWASLTNCERSHGADNRGNNGLVRSRNARNDSRLGGSPGGRLVGRRGHDASDRLGRSLVLSRVDRRASRRSPWDGVGVRGRSVGIAPRLGRGNEACGSGEKRQHVESELHLGYTWTRAGSGCRRTRCNGLGSVGVPEDLSAMVIL